MRRAQIAALVAAATITVAGISAVACGGDDGNGDNGGGETPVATRPAASPTAAVTAAATEPAGSETPASAETPASVETPAAVETPAGGTEGGTTQTVAAENFAFSPATFTATVGQPIAIVLENGDQAPHTLTVYRDAGFQTPVAGADTGTVSGGSTGQFVVTFDEAGTYSFRCDIHTNMQGTITVS